MWFVHDTIRLIELFKNYPELWDLDDIGYKDREKRKIALKAIADEFEVDVLEVEKKLKGLRTQFAREMVKYEDSNGSYKSPWFGFQLLHFLTKSRKIRYNLVNDECTMKRSLTEQDDNDSDNFKVPDFVITAENGLLDCNNGSNDENVCYTLKNEPEIVDDNLSLKRSVVYLTTSQQEKNDDNNSTNSNSYNNNNNNKRFRDNDYNEKCSAIIDTTRGQQLLISNNNDNSDYYNHAERDEFVVFGEHVGHHLRRIKNPYARSVAQYYISNILFQAETTNYNKNLTFKAPSDFTLFRNVPEKNESTSNSF